LAAVLAVQTVAAAVLITTWPSSGTRPELPFVADSGPVVRTLSAVNMSGTRGAALLDRVRADFGGAVAAVERFWGTDWPREIAVVATDSQAQFQAEARLDPHREWGDIAGVAVAEAVDTAQRRAVGQRIVLAPGATGMSDEALRIVLTHELFHLAARADTALDAPRWLTEGVADFVARPAAPLPAVAAGNTTLPSDTELDAPGPGRSAGYDRAWWFARFVAEEFGADRLRLLYTAACGPGHGDFPWAVREALDVDLTELQVRWAAWLNR
jgi:hypothetical protein